MAIIPPRRASDGRSGWYKPGLLPPGTATFLPGDPRATEAVKSASLLVNCLSEPDYERDLLLAVQDIAPPSRAVINHPSDILRQRRSTSSVLLADADLLCVPECIDGIAHPDFLSQAPRLLREIGTNDGQSLVLAKDENEIRQFIDENRGKPIYATAYVDYRSPDGLFRKYRARMVDGKVLPIHMYASTHWCVHSHDAMMAFAERPELLEEEAHYLEGGLAHIVEPALTQLHARIGTDLYGVDFAILPDNRVLFFEANAAMAFVIKIQMQRPAAKRATERFFDAFRAMISGRIA